MRRLSAEYIAGFFDGEGCIYVGRNSRQRPTYTLEVSIVNTDRRPLDQLYARFGGCLQVRQGGQQYHWRITGQRAQQFLNWIRPHAVIKDQQIRLALEFMAARERSSRWRPLTPETLAVREGFRLALQAAKRLR